MALGEEVGARPVPGVLADDAAVPRDERVERRRDPADQLEVHGRRQAAGQRAGGVDVGEDDGRRALRRLRQVGHPREHGLVALADQGEHPGREERRVDQRGAHRRAVGVAQADPEHAHRPLAGPDLQVQRQHPQRRRGPGLVVEAWVQVTAQGLGGLGGEEVAPQRALEHLVDVLAVGRRRCRRPRRRASASAPTPRPGARARRSPAQPSAPRPGRWRPRPAVPRVPPRRGSLRATERVTGHRPAVLRVVDEHPEELSDVVITGTREDVTSRTALGDQAGEAELGEVLRHGRAGRPQAGGEGGDVQLIAAEQPQHPQTGGVGQHPQTLDGHVDVLGGRELGPSPTSLHVVVCAHAYVLCQRMEPCWHPFGRRPDDDRPPRWRTST